MKFHCSQCDTYFKDRNSSISHAHGCIKKWDCFDFATPNYERWKNEIANRFMWEQKMFICCVCNKPVGSDHICVRCGIGSAKCETIFQADVWYAYQMWAFFKFSNDHYQCIHCETIRAFDEDVPCFNCNGNRWKKITDYRKALDGGEIKCDRCGQHLSNCFELNRRCSKCGSSSSWRSIK